MAKGSLNSLTTLAASTNRATVHILPYMHKVIPSGNEAIQSSLIWDTLADLEDEESRSNLYMELCQSEILQATQLEPQNTRKPWVL